jgi:geranylgeranyl pyrophosphate synthase
MHARKTGALIRASVMMATECVPTLDARLKAGLAIFADAIGLAFQIQDDLLDVIGETAVLGKTAGADQALAKPTYPAVAGVAVSRSAVSALHQRALEALEPFGERAEPLRLLSDWLVARRS